jgi:hypothetical protein
MKKIELIDIVEKICLNYRKKTGEEFPWLTKEQWMVILHTLSELGQYPQWFKTENELPDDDIAVLLTFEDNPSVIMVGYRYEGSWLDIYDTVREPSHWMHRPAAPDFDNCKENENERQLILHDRRSERISS